MGKVRKISYLKTSAVENITIFIGAYHIARPFGCIKIARLWKKLFPLLDQWRRSKRRSARDSVPRFCRNSQNCEPRSKNHDVQWLWTNQRCHLQTEMQGPIRLQKFATDENLHAKRSYSKGDQIGGFPFWIRSRPSVSGLRLYEFLAINAKTRVLAAAYGRRIFPRIVQDCLFGPNNLVEFSTVKLPYFNLVSRLIFGRARRKKSNSSHA